MAGEGGQVDISACVGCVVDGMPCLTCGEGIAVIMPSCAVVKAVAITSMYTKYTKSESPGPLTRHTL